MGARQFIHAMIAAFGAYTSDRFSFKLPNLNHLALLPSGWKADIRPWQRRKLEVVRRLRKQQR